MTDDGDCIRLYSITSTFSFVEAFLFFIETAFSEYIFIREPKILASNSAV